MFDQAPEKGGRRVQWLRNWRTWTNFAGYFPMQLIKVTILHLLYPHSASIKALRVTLANLFLFSLGVYFFSLVLQEADLDPTKNYIFGYHPHGIISMGAFCTFATEGLNFSKRFPGINPRLLTLSSNFNIPLYRDYIMAHGCASVAKESCEYILNSGPGNSIAIVVGGAQESLAAKPGTLDLTLKKRLGFIKLALVNG